MFKYLLNSEVFDAANKSVGKNIVAHQANLYHTFGGGIAAYIGLAFPEAFDADKQTVRGSNHKLGTYSLAKIKKDFYIANVYSQINFSTKEIPCATHYPSIFSAFYSLVKLEKPDNVFIPFFYGSGLAGGSWQKVEATLKEVASIFNKTNFYVCVRSEDMEKYQNYLNS